MAKLRLIISITGLSLALLACGSLPRVNLSFDAPATTVTISAPDSPTVALTSVAPPTLPPPATPLPPELIREADAEEQLLINLYERAAPRWSAFRQLEHWKASSIHPFLRAPLLLSFPTSPSNSKAKDPALWWTPKDISSPITTL